MSQDFFLQFRIILWFHDFFQAFSGSVQLFQLMVRIEDRKAAFGLQFYNAAGHIVEYHIGFHIHFSLKCVFL